MRTGTAHLPLHGGKAPAYLFQRMVRLAREITYDQSIHILYEAIERARLGDREEMDALKRLTLSYG